MTNRPATLAPDPDEMRRAVRLLYRRGDVVELRAPKAGRDGTISGYFDNADALVQAALQVNGRAPGIYVTLNPVNESLLARSANKAKTRAELTTSDVNILVRRWMLVDIDPVRPAGISSTDEEHEAALERAGIIRAFLVAEGWPESLLIDSGNGAYLVFRLPELPNDQEGTDLVKRCLEALNKRFSDPKVSVDVTVFNAARIFKLPGTVARKGDHTPDRPHRVSRILEVPENVRPVSVELLTQFATQASDSIQSSQSQQFGEAFDLKKWLDGHQLTIRRGPLAWDGRGEKWELEVCPFNAEHTGGCAVITRGSNGALGFKCHHNSCSDKGWRELRALLDGPPEARKSLGKSQTVSAVESSQPEQESDTLPAFPEMAWRGIFADYRETMQGTTEASDVVHFVTLWAAAAVILGRRISMFAGDEIFPNVYLLFFGSTGDKKTTAQRRIFRLLASDIQVLRNVGSTEGIADLLQREGATSTVYLCFWEEISAMLARARWAGASLLEFLTETYDCPPEYRLVYRKQPVRLPDPTPTVPAATTQEWFWKNARAEDFYGGFGNRFAYFTGAKKKPLPSPCEPDGAILEAVGGRLRSLGTIPRGNALFSDQARRLFESFYMDWETRERSGLYGAAVKRIHVHVRKLAMVYAACEGTLPVVNLDQTKAAIAVGLYAAECARLLVDAQASSARPEGALEERFRAWVREHSGASKRYMQQTLSKYAGSCEVFNRTLKSLLLAEQIEIREGKVFPLW